MTEFYIIVANDVNEVYRILNSLTSRCETKEKAGLMFKLVKFCGCFISLNMNTKVQNNLFIVYC